MSQHLPPKSSLLALWGAAVAAVGASVCCVVPLVLVLMGISGAWIANLTAFDVWRPWLSALTTLCLAWAFWTQYRSGAQRCSSDDSCTDTPLLRRRRRWLWIAAGGIVLLLLFPYYISWFL